MYYDERDSDPSEWEEQIALLWATLEQIPMQFREPLVMYYRQNQSVADIAAVLELTEDAVRQRIARGRTFLKKEVERRVEQTLWRIKPGEHFTVAVLAALPVFATAPEVFAAGSAAGAASAAAKSSGSASLLAGSTAYLHTLLMGIFLPLALLFGPIFGAWNSVRNSPTLRSRHFMLKAVVFQTLMLFSLFLFFVIAGRDTSLCLELIGEMSISAFGAIFFIAWTVVVGLYFVISNYKINKRWRKIVEEDMMQPTNLEGLERSGLSLWSLGKFLFCSLAMPCIAVLLTIPFTMMMIELCTSQHWWTYFEYIRSNQKVNYHIGLFGTNTVPLSFIVIFTTLIFSLVVRWRIASENSLTTWQPKIPNYLQVLTGEEIPKQGLSYRTNLWNDILLVGVWLCMLQGLFCEKYWHPTTVALGNQHYYIPVFVISFVAYLLFAMFFAGIPRKRYFGYIYFGTFLAVLNTVFALFIDPWFDFGGRLVMLVYSLFWLFCFVMSGVLGLRAFRKKNLAGTPATEPEV